MAFGPYAEHAILKKHVSKKDDVKVVTITKQVIRGQIDAKDVTTSLVERNNSTSPTFLRRTTRKTMGFSRRLKNLRAATAIYLAVYNYCWRVRTIKTTPAVQAGIAGKRFSFDDLYCHLRENWPHLFYFGEKAA
jgi:hypothetical protein